MQTGPNSLTFENVSIEHDGSAVVIDLGTESYRFTDTGVLEAVGLVAAEIDSPDFGSNDIANVNRLDAGEIIVQNAPSTSDDLARNQDVPDSGAAIGTFARNINSLYQDTTEVQYSVGLSTLDYRNGEFDSFGDTSRSDSTTNVDISTSQLSLASVATSGNPSYTQTTDFIPSRCVVSHDATLNQGDIYYEIGDGSANIETVNTIDSEVELPSLSDTNITIRAVLTRPTDTDTSPELDSFALYLD